MKAFFNRLIRFFSKQQKAKVYFAHIPKTAGTSYIVLLDRYFKHEHIFPHQLWRDVDLTDRKKLSQFKLFRGHFGGGGIHALNRSVMDKLTILRHPYSLSFSTYRFVLREKNTAVHDLLQKEAMNFFQFLKHPRTSRLVSNRQVRNLSFDFQSDPEAQEVFLSPKTIDHIQSLFNKKAVNMEDEKRLDRAKLFIDESRWFGLQEKFDQSMQLFSFAFQLPAVGSSQKLNRKKTESNISVEEKKRLQQLNKCDLHLYEYAERLFEQKYNSMLSELEKLRSDKHQDIDQLLDINYQNKQVNTLQSKLDYRFNQPLIGSNWHRRELMQPENEFFRWTGPAVQSSIDFWLKAHDYKFEMRIINSSDVQKLADLKLTINQQPIKWHSIDKGHIRIIKSRIPARFILKNGLTRLKIDTIAVKTHAETFSSEDERLVGVAIHWIKLTVCKKQQR